MIVLLETNSLGILTHFNTKVNKNITKWLISMRRAKVEVKVPEICDYELRRSLIRINSLVSINKLDSIKPLATFHLIPTQSD
jgi:hypothetical protein